ncbi:hypothetical protein [Basilea psittacipulmonis]|uniref:Uncharacterized protein n=1 Tax=Basilea psittacipulmonis DSM 24701 TaxID=1072685 RepID=A0A077DCY6_9BURK|nr:hypothetical protein [Basilea psittacipulmonis]AIL32036.1 hypothetical protein IX83_00675 [Basilea psittacipulmonis DSM 24701]
MSWRSITFILIVLAILAVMAGVPLGEKLGRNVPTKSNLADTTANDLNPAVSANGLPIMHQPPQPLMDGTMGVPKTLPIVDWRIDPDNRTQADTAALSSSSIQFNFVQGSTATNIAHTEDVETIDHNRFKVDVMDSQAPLWVSSFKRAMSECRAKGFNERPACIREVRQLYCGANHAWGEVEDCPAQ